MRKRNQGLSVKKVLVEFQKAEESTARRKGTFKIDVSFDEALRSVLKVKPEHKTKSK